MPLNKTNHAIPSLTQLLIGLVDHGVQFILVGGLAEVAQGAPITTIDVDIVHRRTEENIGKLIRFLRSIDARYRRLDDKIIEPTEDHLLGTGHSLLTTRLGALDILGSIEQGYSYDDLLPHSIEITLRGRTVRILSLEKIIELKKAAGTPQDAHRLVLLEETLRQLQATEEDK